MKYGLSKCYLKNRLKHPLSLTGFTLIELVIVIVVMLILATVGALTQFRSYDALKLDAAAQKIASDIRFAQELVTSYSSLATSGPGGQYAIVVDFDETLCAANSYCLKGEPEHVITHPTTGQPWQVNIGTEFPGVVISSANLAQGGYNMFAFRSPVGDAKACQWQWGGGGVCEWPAELYSAGGTVTLTYRGRTKTIRISQVTGRASIE